MKLNHTEAQCRADAAREAEAGDPDQSVGLPAPQLTTKQLCSIGFAVLRAHNDDRLWRALTYDSGPYDLTTPNLALRDLGQAFYAAGCAEAPKTTMKVEVSLDPEMVRRTLRAETEVALLRAAMTLPADDQQDAARFRMLLQQHKHWLGVFRCDPDGTPSDSLDHVELKALLDQLIEQQK